MASIGNLHPVDFRGWLLKWTNYIKGYQRRWFVLSDGLLSYYRTQEDMAHTCRGTINLAAAFIDTIDATHFMVTSGHSQVYHLRAANEVERQKWVTALELAKAKAIKKLDSDLSDNSSENETGRDGTTNENPLDLLHDKLKELNAAYELVVKNSHQIFPTEWENGANVSKKPKEKIALFKIASLAMIKAAEEFMLQAKKTEKRWSRSLQHEHSLRLQLQENIETLANQMHGFEDEVRQSVERTVTSHSGTMATGSESSVDKTRCRKKVTASDSPDGGKVGKQEHHSSEEDDDEFFDASEVSVKGLKNSNTDCVQMLEGLPVVGLRRSVSAASVNDSASMHSSSESSIKEKLPQISSDRKLTVHTYPSPNFFENIPQTMAERRSTIPPKPSHKLNLWTLLKNYIDKDMTKVPMPVNFNEPLSMLQRMSEELHYSHLLTEGAQCSSTIEESVYVAAFVNSVYASTINRIQKPFNPLLYETYECDYRADPKYGWRIISEQVSHHPPMFAMHVEHKDWTFWQEYTVTSKFRGQYLVCYPLGCNHLVMHRSKSHYTWTKVTTTIHNIIVGKLWIDQSGDLKITNHTTGERCNVKYHAYSYFSREQQRKITGRALDSNGTPCYVIRGNWDDKFTFAKVIGVEGKNLVTDTAQTLWQADPPEPGSEVMYGFSKFVCSLNAPEEGVAPTDCRLRPDIRIMEEQDFDRANAEKVKLEEKQRARRRKRESLAAKAAEAAAAGYMKEAERLEKASIISPVWFTKEYNHLTNTMMHVYKGGYWEAKAKGNWHELNLPEIF